jgi:hypothetical protein
LFMVLVLALGRCSFHFEEPNPAIMGGTVKMRPFFAHRATVPTVAIAGNCCC